VSDVSVFAVSTPDSPAEAEAAKLAVNVRRHMPVLDGLRGIAIALVVAHNTGHVQTSAATKWHKLLYPLHLQGWVGVHLFFVLSGFLITGILLDAKPRAVAADFFRSFYVRRTLRIFPLYYATLVVSFFVAPVVAASFVPPTPFSTQVWFWAYLANWSIPYGIFVPYLTHFWSLAVEEQFYLAWPLVVWLLPRRALVVACGVIAVIALADRFWLIAHDAPALATYQFTSSRMDALVLGGAAALAARTPAAMRRVAPYLLPVIVVTGLFCPYALGYVLPAWFGATLEHSILAVFFTAVVLAAVRGEARGDRVSRALSHPALRFLGRYSYAIYVVHQPLANAMMPFIKPYVEGPSFAVAAVAMVGDIAFVGGVSIAFALVSWNVFEKRFLALKDRLAPRAAAGPSGSVVEA
jgi:peptidoglycan/LPS O-acetylase OafA/YrhL